MILFKVTEGEKKLDMNENMLSVVTRIPCTEKLIQTSLSLEVSYLIADPATNQMKLQVSPKRL